MNVFSVTTIVVVCVDQVINAMRCLSLGIIYVLMQARYNAQIFHAVGINSAYCFGLCYFGINVREKSSCHFNFQSRNFVLEIGSITGSILQSYIYLCINQ